MERNDTSHRHKLGLALAGGGFRASLFHLGVLRRMAELDLLRYVEVLSTVSGGSIIGALYVLLLKRELDRAPAGTLGRDDYIALVDELHATLVEGIQKNLRTRLFMNPFGILRVILTAHSLGRRMARIYERHLYRKVVADLTRQTSGRRVRRPGALPLKDITIRPGGKSIEGGIEAFNAQACEAAGSAITKIVINATSLNSGTPFRFSCVEIGDAQLGYFRHDEIPEMMARKALLQASAAGALEAALAGSRSRELKIGSVSCDRKTVAMAAWWRRYKTDRTSAGVPEGFEALFELPGFPGRLPAAEFARLRRAKLAAWYIQRGYRSTPPIDGGLTKHEHMTRLWAALRDSDRPLCDTIEPLVAHETTAREQLFDFLIELYLLRSAEVVSSKIRRHWDTLTVGDAVGASACFPPVFPPFLMMGIYDDVHVSRLGLTDGGVFDNTGVTALLDEDCNYIIASDTSGLFGLSERASTGRVGMLGRIVGVLMNNVAELQRSALRERRRVSRAIEPIAKLEDFHALRRLDGLAFFHIDSPPLDGPGVDPGVDRKALASMRTDLDAFGDIEIGALVNHGYAVADRYIREHLNWPHRDAAHWQPATRVPVAMPDDPPRVARIVRAGRAQFFRALKLGAPVSWLFSLAVIASVIVLTWSNVTISRANVLADLLPPWVGSATTWTTGTMPVGVALLVLVGVVLVRRALGFSLVDALSERHLGWARRAATAAKWARSLSGNILWVFGWVIPALVALVTVLAWASYLFFNLPFLRKTRHKA